MLVSVVLPVRDDPPVFRAVESLLAARPVGIDVEVIVVDNGSRPTFRQSLSLLPPGVRVMDEPLRGPAAARNRGIGAARGDVLFFIDADCVAAPDWIAAGLRGLEVTGADLVRGSSPGILSNRQSRFVDRATRPGRRWRDGAPCRIDTKNLAVRRAVFDGVRFNEDSYRAEDTEFGLAAEAAGFRTAYWGAMLVTHEAEASVRDFVARRIAGGWVLRRLELERAASRGLRRLVRARLARIPLAGRMAPALLLLSAAALDATARVLPVALGGGIAHLLSRLGTVAGGLRYEAGLPQRWPSELLGRRA